MEREYVGIDLHRRRSVVVRLSDTGERLSTVRIDNDAAALAAAVTAAREHPEVVIEATYGWYCAVDELHVTARDGHNASDLAVVAK